MINTVLVPKITMTFALLNRTQAGVPPSLATFRAWLTGANPGERFEYHRGLLARDRIKGASSLKEAERRRLAAVADHALVLADRGELHLLQERHGNGDYSYWAVARAPARPLERVSSRFPIDQRSEVPRP
jgi:hypothetical protein